MACLRIDAKLLADASDEDLQRGDLALESCDIGLESRELPERNVGAWFCRHDFSLGRAAQQVSPAVFTRPGQARQLYDQRACRPGRQFFQEAFYRGDVGKAVQALAVDPQLAGRLRTA